jgi:tetratricopeptide (TPR) repeat protein
MDVLSTAKPHSSPQKNSNAVRMYGRLAPDATIQKLWFSKGKVLTKQGYYEAALASFDASIKLQPNHCKSWVFRGIALTYLEQYRAALASFERALEISPDHREAWIFRGSVLKYLDRPDEAFESYSQALKLQQQDTEICNDYPLWLPIDQQPEAMEA